MKAIAIDLLAIFDGISHLESLRGRVKQSGVSIPEIEGSGSTAQAMHDLAESFQDLENTWDLLLTESVSFFKKMSEAHENLQENLVQAINVTRH